MRSVGLGEAKGLTVPEFTTRAAGMGKSGGASRAECGHDHGAGQPPSPDIAESGECGLETIAPASPILLATSGDAKCLEAAQKQCKMLVLCVCWWTMNFWEKLFRHKRADPAPTNPQELSGPDQSGASRDVEATFPLLLVVGRNPDLSRLLRPSAFDLIASNLGIYRSDIENPAWNSKSSLVCIQADPSTITRESIVQLAAKHWGSFLDRHVWKNNVIKLDFGLDVYVAAFVEDLPKTIEKEFDSAGYFLAAFPRDANFAFYDSDVRLGDKDAWDAYRKSLSE